MEFAAWLKRVTEQDRAYEGCSFADDQILLLHSNDSFFMYVIDANGVREKKRCSSTNGIYKYLLDNYCNKGDKVTKFKKVNVYYDDPVVKRAMECGIRKADGTFAKVISKDNGHIINQTTMFRCINLRWVHYYFGIDIKDLDDIDAVIKGISERTPSVSYTSGFTSALKKKFVTPTIYTDYVITKRIDDDYNYSKTKSNPSDFNMIKTMSKRCNLGALLGCTRNIELRDIYSYDITSAYIYHLFNGKFPTNKYKYITYDEYLEADKDKYAFFFLARLKLCIKPIYAKKEIFPLPEGLVSATMKDKCKVTEGGKVIYCEDMVFGLWGEDMEYIQEFYNIDGLDMLQTWQFELKELPKEFKREMLNLYRKKQNKKERGENYKTEKIILNRGGYGLWVTKKDEDEDLPEEEKLRRRLNPNLLQLTERIPADWAVPFQIGAYIVALQRKLLLNTMQSIGMDHVVAFHTDSIKTDINCDDFFERYNEKIDICDDLGHFEKEWMADRCYFFNSVRYKADALVKNKETGEYNKRKLIVKHGGIDEKDMKPVFGMSYDDITADTEIEITKPHSEWIDPITGKKSEDRVMTKMSITEDYMLGKELLAM